MQHELNENKWFLISGQVIKVLMMRMTKMMMMMMPCALSFCFQADYISRVPHAAGGFPNGCPCLSP